MDVVLVAPPTWYFAAVPADLAYTVAGVRAAGLRATARDWSMAFAHHALGRHPAWAALRAPATYRDIDRQHAAQRALYRAQLALRARTPADWGLRHLHLGGVDPGDVVAARAAAVDPSRNPAADWLDAQVRALLRDPPRLVGIALVHPDQGPQVLAVAALLRRHGYDGTVAVYGTYEDVIGPLDFAPDLVGDPPHRLFDHVDAVIQGEAVAALAALARGRDDGPNTLRAGDGVVPPLVQGDPATWPDPAFDWVRPEHYPFPAPVVDLRLGRGCPWGRCAFCAIQAHHPGYRFGPAARVARAMAAAHRALGSTFFRVRDDLLTPRQLADLGAAVRDLDFHARWMARSRFEPALSAEVLSAATGLEELWLGLESAVPRVRDAMDKGVRDDVVARILAEAPAAGVGLRLLCLLGFPGETEDEARRTLDFVARHQRRVVGVSLTPFQLMRRSPMAADPARWGVVVGTDPVPRHRRLRHTLPVASAPGISHRRAVQLKAGAVRRLGELVARNPGPWPSHVWMGRSIRAGG